MGFTIDIPTPLNLRNTAVKRDNSSEFAVTTVHGNLDGNATSADDGVTEVVGTNGLTLVLSNKTITGSIDSSIVGGKLQVQENGTVIGQQGALNLIAGSNVSISATNDIPNNRVSVTISSTGQIVSATSIGGTTGAVPVYKQTAAGVLQFRQLNAASNKVNVGLDGFDEVAVDIVPGNIDHQTLEGAGELTHSEIDSILSDLSPTDSSPLSGLPLTIVGGSTIKYSGWLSYSATAAYKSGDSAGANVSYIINDATFVLSTPNTTSAINDGDQGSLDLYVNGSLLDTFNLFAVFDESFRNSSQTYPSTGAGTSTGGHIVIQSVGKYNNFRTYQKVVAQFSFTSSNLVEGYNSISLVHNGVSQTSQTFDLYYDKDTGSNPSINTPTLTGLSQTSSKYLSGIRFAGTNDTISLAIIGSNLFNNVYHNQPITYSSLTGVVNDVVAVTDGAVTGVSNPPHVGETMTVSSKTLTFTGSGVCSNNGRITCVPRDPYGSYTSQPSASQNLLISTFGSANSNNKNEFFKDEQYRLPLSYDFTSISGATTAQWDSTAALTSGNAQVYFYNTTTNGLIYPSINFTTGYVPAQSGRNYSAFSGNQQYARAFLPTINQTSISVTFNGLGAGIGSLGTSDVNIEIKLPGQTGWLDAAVPYSSAAGVSSDGLGCLNGSISYAGGNAVVAMTFGGKSTGDAGGRMFMRITLINSNRSISTIATNW